VPEPYEGKEEGERGGKEGTKKEGKEGEEKRREREQNATRYFSHTIHNFLSCIIGKNRKEGGRGKRGPLEKRGKGREDEKSMPFLRDENSAFFQAHLFF